MPMKCNSIFDPTPVREQMVQTQLRGRGIHDDRVLDVMASIPRERFLPSDLAHLAYEDRALPIELEQTISQPYIVAFMTEALRISPHHRVLEIGTGTGYQTAILAQLADRVYSIERHEPLSHAAALRLQELGITNVEVTTGDGSVGWGEHAPYDRIIVTAASPDVPSQLVEQLTEGGRMIVPVGDEHAQRLTLIERHAGRTVERPSIAVRFVKLVGRAGFDN